MEEPIQTTEHLQLVKNKAHPVIDVSYVELPAKLTSKIDLSSVLGAIAFLSMLAAPAAVEGEMYITAVVLVAIFAGCAYLSVKEGGKK